MTDTCPDCGAGDSEQIPVWEDELFHKLGAEPDYIGCTNCNTMRNNKQFKHYPMVGKCQCGSFETMYVGEELIDEKCCRCGLIIGGGYSTDRPEANQ